MGGASRQPASEASAPASLPPELEPLLDEPPELLLELDEEVPPELLLELAPPELAPGV
jgi:hypothetical protein